jgi:DNA-binding transcriptional MerR regulator
VGDVARLTGKTVRALHLYEEMGLVEPTLRSKGGFRLYDEDAVVRVHWITRLQDMGFSLPEIRDLLRDWSASHSAPEAMQRVHDLYRRKQEETRLQIEKLQGLLAELGQSLAYLETCSSCEPERVVSACAVCDRHDCDPHPPMLVAGFQSANG